jgi:hypothetical protein
MTTRAYAARQQLQARLLDKAWKDAAFRRALTADPSGTLERELGMTVPAGVRLTVVEETPTQRYLVLPAAPPRQEGELSDRELEAVAGGYEFTSGAIPLVACVIGPSPTTLVWSEDGTCIG